MLNEVHVCALSLSVISIYTESNWQSEYLIRRKYPNEKQRTFYKAGFPNLSTTVILDQIILSCGVLCCTLFILGLYLAATSSTHTNLSLAATIKNTSRYYCQCSLGPLLCTRHCSVLPIYYLI